MNGAEEKLNKAIEQMLKGASANEVILKYPELDSQRTFLEISENLSKIPKYPAPEPLMRRKYAELPIKRFVFEGLKISKFASLSTGLILLISAVLGTGYASYTSLPGSNLYSIKKSTERLRLVLATSEEAKANLQIEFTKKRISDVEKIINNPESKPEAEKVALNEMLNETKQTIAMVDQAAKSNSINQGHPMVADLENIAKKQQLLLNQIQKNSKDEVITSTALQASQNNVDQVAEIKKYILAASNEQTLADLENNPDLVTITGDVAKLTENKISVEKTEFLITKDTIIKDSDYNQMDSSGIKLKDKVKIFGLKKDNTLTANQIFLVKLESSSAQVEGTSTEKTILSEVASSTPATTGTPDSNLKKTEKNEEILDFKNSTIPEKNPNTATGGMIIEDPAPQSAVK